MQIIDKESVFKNKNTSHLLYNGELVKNVSVGGFVKINKGFIKIICKVEGEYTNEDKIWQNNYSSEKGKVQRVLELSLMGFFEKHGFQRGIKELPLIDNECYLLDNEEFNTVHNFVKKGDVPIEIGKLSLENNLPISVGINSLFASHIGIFGNTGSGKSYTLTSLYRQLFLKLLPNKKFRSTAKFFLIDFNGEYVEKDAIISSKYKTIYNLKTRIDNGDKYPITSDTIHDSTFWSILLDATDKTQKPFLTRTLKNEFINSLKSSAQIKGYIKYLLLLIYDKEDKLLMKSLIDFLYELSDISNSVEFCESLLKRLDFNNKYSEFGCSDLKDSF